MKAGLNLHVDSNQEPDTSRPLLLAPLERDVVWVGRGAAAQPVVDPRRLLSPGLGTLGAGHTDTCFTRPSSRHGAKLSSFRLRNDLITLNVPGALKNNIRS